MLVDGRSATLPTFTQVSAAQPQPVVVKATKAVVYTPTQVNPPSSTPPSSVVSATFADVVSLLAMLLVQLSQVFGVHDVRVSLATFKSSAVPS